MHYQHFTYEERLRIAEYLEQTPPLSRRGIARRLQRAPSSICDEIRRNALPGGRYLACAAHEAALARARRKRGAYKKDHPELLDAIETGLSNRWSPEIMAAKLRQEHPDDRSRQASHQLIYEIVREEKGRGWPKKLPHGGRRRRKRYGSTEKRGRIRNRIGIEKRPRIVEENVRVGDWEGDTIASGRQGTGGLVSLVDRATQYVVLERMHDGTAAELNRVASRGFRRHGPLPGETLTVDNGREFAGHEQLAKRLGVDVYFAHPYHAWERGLNEQVNGMVRWWFPKGTDFSQVSPGDVKRVETLLNERPRKKLGYRTPAEVMREAIVRLQI